MCVRAALTCPGSCQQMGGLGALYPAKLPCCQVTGKGGRLQNLAMRRVLANPEISSKLRLVVCACGSSCMYGDTVLVPYQSPAPSHPEHCRAGPGDQGQEPTAPMMC